MLINKGGSHRAPPTAACSIAQGAFFLWEETSYAVDGRRGFCYGEVVAVASTVVVVIGAGSTCYHCLAARLLLSLFIRLVCQLKGGAAHI